MGMNTGGADFQANQIIFEIATSDYGGLTSGGLYGAISNYFRTGGVDFISMNLILNLVSIVALYLIIRRHTDNRNFALSLFMIFPMFDFIIQKRAFLAVPFILLSLEVLNTERKGKYIYSLVLAFISSQIHSSSLFFFLIILLYFIYEKVLRERKRHHKKFHKIILVLITVLYFFLSSIPGLIERFAGIGRTELYLGEDTITLSSALAWIGIHIIFVLFQIIMHRGDKNASEKDKKFGDFVSAINAASLILLPLYLYESVFFRLFKVILILNYISISNIIINKDEENRVKVMLYLLFVIVIFMLVYVWTGLGFDFLITPLFENNIFIQWFIGA